MADSSTEALLAEILLRAQTEGALGARPIADVIAHARGFVAALPFGARSLLDLGSGAGVPGLVIALDRPDVRVTLVDRRDKRVDALRRAIAALGWGDRVDAVASDAELLCRDPAHRAAYDVVVARGFGDPTLTLPIAVQCARVGGAVIISEPPLADGSRWDVEWVRTLGVSPPERVGSVVRFHVEHTGVGHHHSEPVADR